MRWTTEVTNAPDFATKLVFGTVRAYLRGVCEREPSRLPDAQGPLADWERLDVIRREVRGRPRVEQPTWLPTERQRFSVDDVAEIAIVAHDELEAIADNRDVLRQSIAALVAMLGQEPTVQETAVREFLRLDLAAPERERVLARASGLVLAAQPAVDRETLVGALRRACEDLNWRAMK